MLLRRREMHGASRVSCNNAFSSSSLYQEENKMRVELISPVFEYAVFGNYPFYDYLDRKMAFN